MVVGLAALLVVPSLVAPSQPVSTATSAEEDGSSFWADLVEVQIHGFVSQGAIKSSTNNYLGESERGTLEFTEVGINFTKSLAPDLSAGMQLFARRLAGDGDFTPQFDWFYLDYRWADLLGFRAGRTKLPFGLYNESSDVDSARVAILLPQGVYPIRNRDFYLAQNGVELYGRIPAAAAGALGYRLYAGTITVRDPVPTPGQPVQVIDLGTPYLVGSRLTWDTPITGLRLGFSLQALRIDLDAFADESLTGPLIAAGRLPAAFDGRVTAELPAVLWLASLEYNAPALLISAEYGRVAAKLETSQPVLFPESEVESEQFYLMASLPITSWLQAGTYYSALFPNIDRRSLPDGAQHDFAVSFRFDPTSFWLIKVEAHYLIGTAALSAAENQGRAPAELDEQWALFLAKTTVQF